MRLQDYELTIPEGKEDAQGYVALKHEQVYTLSLKNDRPTRCDAKVYIDGKYQGAWRLNPFQTARLEHPAHDQGRFTFYELNSKEGQDIDLPLVSKRELGLVEVTFIPEAPKKRDLDYEGTRGGGLDSSSSRGLERSWGDEVNTRYGAGGTGLSEDSSQVYGNAQNMNLDHNKKVTLYLRLVVNKPSPRPLTEAPQSSPLPPPVI